MENNNKKIENLLALILLKALGEVTIAEKSLQLNKAGFSHSEIADFLGTTSAVIKQSLYAARKGKKPTKSV
jgi:hypothetical protein